MAPSSPTLADFAMDGRDPYFRAHRIAGSSIVIGMYALAHVIDEARKALGASTCSLRTVSWMSPVEARDTQAKLRVAIDDSGATVAEVRWSGTKEHPTLTALCQLDTPPTQRPPAVAADLVRRLLESPTEDVYGLVERYGITHDPILRVIDRCVVGVQEVLFSASVSALAAESGLSLSPALLNGAFAAALALAPFARGRLAVPLSIGRIEVYGPLRGRCVGLVRALRQADKTFSVDVTLYDEHGQATVVMRDLTAVGVDDADQLRQAPMPRLPRRGDVAGVPMPAAPAAGKPDLHAELTSLVSGLVNKDMSHASPDATFMELGLSSAELLRLATDMEARLGVELYPTFFFEYQTLGAAAAYLEENGGHLKSEVPVQAARELPGMGAAEAALESDQGAPQHVAASSSRDIAIIGMGCRFAGASDPDEFWADIAAGRDMVSDVPLDRWRADAWFDGQVGTPNKTYCRSGSFIDGVDKFDAGFFAVSPNEARAMDPQLRLLLEVLYHTAQDAGYAKRIRGSQTGLYVGACFQEYFDEMVRAHVPTSPYDLNASASSFISNRASYFFDLRGPSLTVDVACSSSLVALHLASKALQAGEIDTAFVAGVNLLLSPLHYLQFSAIGALSASGRCHSFDSRADGYVPGEGIAAVLLKPLDAALRDGDRVMAVIKGSAVNHCGRSNSPTAPSISQQTALLRAAWRDARIEPASLGYIEAHGTGTKLGDPIEIAGIARAFEQGGARGERCFVGSVKSNIGHTEGAAGLAGVLKVVQMLRHRLIPAMANFRALNPLLPIDKSGLEVNTQPVTWQEHAGHPRRGAVSSFGLGGGYAHVVLEEAPAHAAAGNVVHDEGGQPLVFPLSADSANSLREQVARFERILHATANPLALRSLAAVLQHCADGFKLRTVFIGHDSGALHALLARANDSERHLPIEGLHCEPAGADEAVLAAARAWLNGGHADWPTQAPRMCDVAVNAPLYPFDRQSYWFAAGQGTVGAAESEARISLVPLLAPSKAANLRFAATEIDASHPFLDQHRIMGTPIVPGVVHLEWFMQAAYRADGKLPIRVRDLYWLSPLVGEAVRCELEWQRAGDESLATLRMGATEAATALLDGAVDLPRPAPVDLGKLLGRLRHERSGQALYDEVEALGLALGDYFRTIEVVHGDGHECLIRMQEGMPQACGFILAPGLLDGINHGLRGIVVDASERIGLAIPYHIASIICYEDTSSARFLHAARTESPMCYDLNVLDGQGRVLAELRGFQLRAFRDSAAAPVQRPTAGDFVVSVAPRATPETVTSQLEALMREVTGHDLGRLGDQQELAQHGVDSVAVAQFTRKLNRLYGLNLAPAIFFEHKTLASYARFLCSTHAHKLGASAPSPAAPVPAANAAPSGTPAAAADAVAIVGVVGRFPQCDDLDELWAGLLAGQDFVTDIPADRFDWHQFVGEAAGGARLATQRGGFLRDVASFAASKFGISRREAELMDPQQRILLESVWDVLLDAGYAREDVAGSPVGVFVGAVNNEYYELLNEAGVGIEAHTSTGMARSILANRVSHAFDWSGPSEVVDTACSSSLVAIHRAAQAIRAGECDAAIAAGVNLLLTPKLFLSFSEAGMLSPGGKCKTFDAGADGYVRAEGCAALLMKPLAKALADGDFVYGVLLGSGINHGGRVKSLTVPNPSAQADLLERVFRQAGVRAEDIGYIEAHGTGTPMGDPIEINGLKRAFERLAGANALAPAAPWCTVGSIKSNMGHLEGAAGIAGVVKALLAMHHGMIPKTLHVSELNPQIELQGSPLAIATRSAPWASADGRRIAGVSSFGFGGVNAHVLLADHPKVHPGDHTVDGPQLIVLSADSPEALLEYGQRMLRHLTSPVSRYGAARPGLRDIARTLQRGRDQLAVRWGVIVASTDELRQRLGDWLSSAAPGNKATPRAVHASADVSETRCNQWLEAGKLDALLACWLDGTAVPWRRLRQADAPLPAPRRTPLPTPPWVRQRYWIPSAQRVALPSKTEQLPLELVHPLFDL